jgi:hypothetical protein
MPLSPQVMKIFDSTAFTMYAYIQVRCVIVCPACAVVTADALPLLACPPPAPCSAVTSLLRCC